MITVKLFAILKDKAGSNELRMNAGTLTVSELLDRISREYPALSDLISHGGTMVSINQEFAEQDAVVRDGDEVALMPPFSGGALEQISNHKSQITNNHQ